MLLQIQDFLLFKDNKIPLYIYPTFSLPSTHSSVDRHLGCFLTLALVKNAATSFEALSHCGFFFFFWLCWVFVAAHGLSLVAVRGATLHCGARASHCSGFSCCRARALGAWASVVAARGL